MQHICKAAIKQYCFAIKFINHKIRNQKEIIYESLNESGYVLKYLSRNLF